MIEICLACARKLATQSGRLTRYINVVSRGGCGVRVLPADAACANWANSSSNVTTRKSERPAHSFNDRQQDIPAV